MDKPTLLTELNLRIGDTDNFTFTPDEKNSALTEAMNDKYAVTSEWDTTLILTASDYQYPLPSGVTSIQDIYIKADNSLDNPQKIDSSYWEVVGSNLQLHRNIGANLTGYTLYLKSNTKYASTDTITSVDLQEYILKLAQLRLYQTMLNKKSMRFLKNDTSVGEIVTIKRELQQDVKEYRNSLPTGFQVA